MRLSRHLLSLLVALAAVCPGFAQNFANPKVIPTGNWPAAVYSADVNGDGYPDLIYIDQGASPGQPSTTHVLLNDGKGNFTQSAIIATAGDSVALGDFDGDGKLDIAWITYHLGGPAPGTYIQMNLASGKGDGTFVTHLAFTGILSLDLAFKPGFLTSGHFISTSGLADFIFEDMSTPAVFVLTQFAGAGYGFIMYPSGSGPLALSDLNGDGHQDIIVQQGSGSVAVYLGTGLNLVGGPNVIPNPTQNFTGLTGVHSFLLQDVNLDGRPDLIAEGANGHIDVYFGNGDGTFQTTSSGGTGPVDGRTGNGGQLIATGDFNHDGQVDALTATPIGVSTLLGQGTQYLGLKGIYNAGPAVDLPSTTYAVADFNGDGNQDVALPSPEGIAILYGNADGSFQSSRAFAAGQPAMSGDLGAFTSSGKVDAVVSTSNMQAQLLQGQGDGTFVAAPSPTSDRDGTPGLWSVVKVADLNTDGKLDLLLTADGPAASLPATPTGIQVQLGDGAANFAAPYSFAVYPTLGCAHSPGCYFGVSAIGADLLGPDISNRDAEGINLIITGSHIAPDGTGYYEPVAGATPGGLYSHDLTVAGIFTPRIAFNQGVTDTFAQSDGHLYLYPTYGPYQILTAPAGDLSVDGSLTTPGQLTAPALSTTFNGPAIPTTSGGLGFPAFIGSAAVADLDRDGNEDLIVVYANLSADLQAPTAAAPNKIYIWFGSSATSNFPASVAHPVNPVVLTPSRNFYQVAIADVNGDGIPDLVLSDGYIVSVQTGRGDGTFGAETHYLGGQGINTISVADINHDGKLDLVLANGGSVLTNPVANLDQLATNPDVNTGGVTVLLNPTPAVVTPTGTLTASPEPSAFGTAFNLVLTFAAAGPTGTVSFSIDGANVGMASISGNSATLAYPVNDLAVGTHTITATFPGDSTHLAGTYSASHTVSKAAPLTSLTANPEPSAYGTPLILAAYINSNISGIEPTGLVSFQIDGVVVASQVPLVNGVATYHDPTTTLAPGPHTVTATYPGDTNYNAVTLNTAQYIGLVSASPEPSPYGSSFTVTTTAGPGRYDFFVDSTYIGPVISATNSASIVVPGTFAVGIHTISVSWGTQDGSASSIFTGTHTVAAASVGSVTASPEPSTYGSSFVITGTAPGPGQFTFSVDGTVVGTVTSSSNTASVVAPGTFTVGSHALLLSWLGTQSALAVLFTGTHQIVQNPTTLSLLLCVDPPGSNFPCGNPIDNTPLISPITFFYGQSLDGVAIESATSLGGNIIFYNNANVFCTIPANLTGGSNMCPTQSGYFNAGIYSVHAAYTGDANNLPSTSNSILVNVFADATTSNLLSSANPAVVGTNVTFTMPISGNYATPSGTVNFYNGSPFTSANLLGTATLDATGTATFSTANLAVGTYSIYGVYNSNPNFSAIQSVITQVIAPAAVVPPPPTGTGYTLTVTPDPVTVGAGATGILLVKVAGQSSQTPQVTLSCSGLPEETTCTFVTPTLPAGGGATTLQLHVTAPHDCGSNTPYFIGSESGPASPVPYTFAAIFAGAAAIFRRRRSLRITLVLIATALVSLASLSGCGHCTDLGTRPGNYTFTVIATPDATSTGGTEAVTIPLTVTIP